MIIGNDKKRRSILINFSPKQKQKHYSLEKRKIDLSKRNMDS